LQFVSRTDDGFDLGGGEVFSVGGHVAATPDDLAHELVLPSNPA
jgi:hypothetical protein